MSTCSMLRAILIVLILDNVLFALGLIAWIPNCSRGDEYFCAVAAKVTGGRFYCADGERKAKD